MAWLRYIVYFFGLALITWTLTQLEISFPGSMQLQVLVDGGHAPGGSEFSPLQFVQPCMLCICGLLMLWVAQHCPSQRPIALPFAGIALAFLLRELDHFMDRYLVDNLWLVLFAITGALLITYVYRHSRRMKVAWARVWPSPAMALLFAGALVRFAFVTQVGQESLWRAVLGTDYVPVVEFAVQELTELLSYLLWLIGTIEYVIQAKAIAYRAPLPAARRRRQKRRQAKQGEF